MALIDCIRNINRIYPERQYFDFYINNHHIGYIDELIINDLPTSLFLTSIQNNKVSLNFPENERELVETKVEQFFKQYLREKKRNVWRDERYAVATEYDAKTLMLIERSALSYLGITGYGVHINGYINKSDGIHMWIAKRSLTKPTAPGKLDQIAAGGIPYNVSLTENVIKECEEEASIPKKLAEKAILSSTLSYWYDLDIGVRPDTIFNYDLELPIDFIPQINDGEVDSFQLLHINDILDIIANTNNFKFNSSVVIVDFALRHNIIGINHPEFVELQAEIQNLYFNDFNEKSAKTNTPNINSLTNESL